MSKSVIKKEKSWFSTVLFTVLTIFSLIMIVLLYWAIITSVKNESDFTMGKNYFGLPKDYYNNNNLLNIWQWNWSNFITITKYFTVTGVVRNGRDVSVPFDMQVVYTVMYACGGAFVATACPCLVAYARKRYDYKFLTVLDYIVLFAMIVPIVGSQASMISLLHSFNIYDTFLALYLQKFNFANMYYLVFVAVFKGVSKEYYEAAGIDGANEFQILTQIALPLVLTSFGLVFLLFFVQFWNDYQTLLVYAPSHPTIAYGLFRVLTDATGSSERGYTTVQMAGCVLITLPVIVLFIIFKDKLMGNVSIGGVKE